MLRLSGLLVLAALAAPAQQETEPGATVTGRVVNSVSGEALRRVNLTLRAVPAAPAALPSGIPPAYTAISGDDGRFRFEKIPAGAYVLSGERTGFIRGAYGARGRGFHAATLELAAGQVFENAEITLAPQAVITGQVLDDEGEPVMRAMVLLLQRRFINGFWQLGGVASLMTPDNGEYRFGNLQPGRYWISAQVTNRVPGAAVGEKEEVLAATFHPTALDPESAVPLDLSPGTELRNIDIRLQKAPVVRVRGRAENLPPGQWRVTLYPRGTQLGMVTSSASNMVGADGMFEIPFVRPGAYWLSLSAATGMVTSLGRTEVDVGSEPVDDVVVRRANPSTITGTIRVEGPPPPAEDPDAPGGPPRAVPIQLQLHALEGPALGMMPVTAKEDGTFRIEDVTPNRYRVNVNGAPAGTYLKAIRAGDQDARQSGLTVGEGVHLAVELVFARDAAQVTGQVVSPADGKPLPGALVTLIELPSDDPANMRSRSATTAQDGRFRAAGLAPGDYLVQAWEDLLPGSHLDPETRRRTRQFARTITLKPNETIDVSLAAAPGHLTGIP